MTALADPFARIPLDEQAVDLAWVNYRWHHLPRIEALVAVTAAGVLFREAALVLDCTTLPSNSGLLARAS